MTTQEPSHVALERELTLLLRRSRATAAQLSREIHPDLDGSAYVLLSYVVQAHGVRAGELAALFGVDKGAISRQVTRLVRAGLLERRPDPQDRRALLLVATDLGERRLAIAVEARELLFRERLRGWPDEDVRDLARLLARWNAGATPAPDLE